MLHVASQKSHVVTLISGLEFQQSPESSLLTISTGQYPGSPGSPCSPRIPGMPGGPWSPYKKKEWLHDPVARKSLHAVQASPSLFTPLEIYSQWKRKYFLSLTTSQHYVPCKVKLWIRNSTSCVPLVHPFHLIRIDFLNVTRSYPKQ